MKKNLKSKWSLKKPLYLKSTDDRYKKYLKQLKSNGFCDCETWSIYSNIAEFIIPRLKRFKEITIAYPIGITYDEWIEIIDKIIFSLEWSLKCDEIMLTKKDCKKDWDKYNEGMELFKKYFMALWW